MAITIKGEKALFPPSINASVTAVRATGTSMARPAIVTGAAAPALADRPVNPAASFYSAVLSSAWAHPGALVNAGRSNYNDPAFHTVAAGGGTVLIYLDTMMDLAVGRYHTKLFNASEFGPAVPDWNGGTNGPSANQYGNLNDIRVGGILQSKLRGVLDLMAAENPHMGGVFLDDVGTWSWYPNFNFGAWSSADKAAYRNGAIGIVQTAHAWAAANRNMVLIVNGLWQALAATGGGGYPDPNQHGCSLVDGGMIENGQSSANAFYVAYGRSAQWGSQTARAGFSYMWYQNKAASGGTTQRDYFISQDVAAFAATQEDYNNGGLPWKSFTNFGLPHGL